MRTSGVQSAALCVWRDGCGVVRGSLSRLKIAWYINSICAGSNVDASITYGEYYAMGTKSEPNELAILSIGAKGGVQGAAPRA